MTFARRLAGVLRLDAETFEDIEADTSGNAQAIVVVIVASAAAGIGLGLATGSLGLVRGTIGAVIGWVMWAAVTYILGARLFPEPQTRTDMGELLRVIGFAYAPEIFNLFAFIPVAGRLVRVVVAFWVLAATVVAVRQALDYRGTGRAFLVVLIGWLFFVLIQALL